MESTDVTVTMKYTYLLFTLACVTIVSLAVTTFAAPPENNDPAVRKAEMLKKFDKDGDGKLSDTEKTTLRAEMQNRRGGGRDRKQWTPEQRDEMLKKFPGCVHEISSKFPNCYLDVSRYFPRTVLDLFRKFLGSV